MLSDPKTEDVIHRGERVRLKRVILGDWRPEAVRHTGGWIRLTLIS